jgi:hypothetical protein
MNHPTNAAKVFARPRKNLLARSVQNLKFLNALEVLNGKRIPGLATIATINEIFAGEFLEIDISVSFRK